MDGRLQVVLVGEQYRLRIIDAGAGATVRDFNFNLELSDDLLQAFRADPASVHGVEVYFRLQSGTPNRVRRAGENFQPPGAANALNAVPTPGNPGDMRSVTAVGHNTVTISGESQPVKFARVKVCEKDTLVGRTVIKRNNQFFEPQYNCERHPKNGKPNCYPYNFVQQPRNLRDFVLPARNYQPAHTIPEPSTKDSRTTRITGKSLQQRRDDLIRKFPEMDQRRLNPDLHTGTLEIVITALSPTIVSHPPGADAMLPADEQNTIEQVLREASAGTSYGPTKISLDTREERQAALQRVRPHMRREDGAYILSATSIKGALRSVLEAYSQSLMPLLPEGLDGRTGHTEAIRHRVGHRLPDAIANRGIGNANDSTVYTYGWERFIPGSGYNKRDFTWTRWVRPAQTPYAKLEHVDAKRRQDHVSLACRMFGRVADAGHPSWAGRIRIGTAIALDSDGNASAQSADEYWFLKSLTRPAGAKAKCEALYLMPKGARRDANGVQRLAHTDVECDQYNNPASEARTRKFYWPHSLGGPGDSRAMPLLSVRDRLAAGKTGWDDPELQLAVLAFKGRVTGHPKSQADTKSWMNPVLPGSTFRCTIRFQNLTDTELGALLKAITLNNPNDGALAEATHCHRIGRAKPLGFGAVVMQIRSLNLVDVDTACRTLGQMPFHKSEEIVARRQRADKAFTNYCAQWSVPVWDEIAALTRIPAELTDYDYWKNWTDFIPADNTAFPLPLALD